MSAPAADDVQPEGEKSAPNVMTVDPNVLRQKLVEKEEVELHGGGRFTVEPESATEAWSKKNVGSCGEGLIVAVRNRNGKRFALKIVLDSRERDSDLGSKMKNEVALWTSLGDNQHVAMLNGLGLFEGLPYAPAVKTRHMSSVVAQAEVLRPHAAGATSRPLPSTSTWRNTSVCATSRTLDPWESGPRRSCGSRWPGCFKSRAASCSCTSGA